MRKGLLTLVIALAVVLQTAWAYDFSATSPSGHTLYYEIISGTTNVGVVRPGTSWTYNNYVTGNVVIPATVTYLGTTYSVTSIGDQAFFNCEGLTSVTIPNSVTSIGEYAFYLCTGLTSVTIPNSVSSIGGWAFAYCSGLTSVTISNSVTSIEEFTFYYCSDLTSATIPDSVNSIGGWAFAYCSGLTSVIIPDSVTSIGEYAFNSCTGLTSVTIPNSVTTIGEGAFSGCSGLTTLNFNAINCGDFSSSYRPFYNCPIATINIGDSVQRIPAYFACNLDSLLSVTIGNSVTVIGNNAFKNCIGIDVIKCKSTIPPTISDSNTWSSVPVDINLIVPCGSSPTYSTTYGWSQFTNIRDTTVYTNIELSVNNELMGYTEVLLNSCDSTIIKATSNEGYSFYNWSDGNTQNPRILTLNSDTSMIAYFGLNTRKITVSPVNDSMGVTIGTGIYKLDSLAMIAAIPANGYRFAYWSDSSALNPYTFRVTPTTDTHFIAYFEEIIPDTVFVHDTTIIIQIDTVINTIHDTVTNTVFDTITNTVYDTIDNFIYDTVYVTETDTLWLFDTIYLHDTIYIYDTIYIRDSTTGIEDVSVINAKIYSSRSRIVVEGAEGNSVMLFDMQGRLLSTKRDEYSVLEFEVPISGAYFVKIGSYKAKKVVVIK